MEGLEDHVVHKLLSSQPEIYFFIAREQNMLILLLYLRGHDLGAPRVRAL